MTTPLTPREQRLAQVLDGFSRQVEAEIEQRRSRSLGGQQVDSHGDFASVPLPALYKLQWWARELAEILTEPERPKP